MTYFSKLGDTIRLNLAQYDEHLLQNDCDSYVRGTVTTILNRGIDLMEGCGYSSYRLADIEFKLQDSLILLEQEINNRPTCSNIDNLILAKAERRFFKMTELQHQSIEIYSKQSNAKFDGPLFIGGLIGGTILGGVLVGEAGALVGSVVGLSAGIGVSFAGRVVSGDLHPRSRRVNSFPYISPDDLK